MEDKLKKSALVDALLFTAFSCVNVMAAETVPANSQIYKEAKSLSKVPANSNVFTGKAESYSDEPTSSRYAGFTTEL